MIQDSKQIEEVTNCNCCDESETIRVLDKENNLWICDNCGYIFDNPRPTVVAITDYYSDTENYDFWLEEEDGRDAMWRRRLSLSLPFVDKGKLLDIGTGTGQFLDIAKKNFEVFGTEVSEKAIEIGKEKYQLEIDQGELGDIKYKEKFDLLTMFHVLEHVPSPKETIEQCSQNLVEGGYIVIAVPNDVKCWKRLAKHFMAMFQIGRFKTYGFGIKGINMKGNFGEIHLSHFTPKTLRYFLETSGFQLIYEGPDPYFCKQNMSSVLGYKFFCLVNRIFKQNLYDTQLVIARKTH